MADFDYCIAGGGVVGLAIAWQLSKHGSVLLLEKNALFGSETSSRNSEVIHAGLYYPPGSLKEQLCLQGKTLLYDFCQQFDVAHKAIGKLIVAPSPDHPKLQQLSAKGKRLGIPLELLDAQQVRSLEPQVKAACALYSPTTGIIDSHEYMQTLAAQAERQGALLMLQTRLEQATDKDDEWLLTLSTSDGPYQCTAKQLINAAGLHATTLASSCGLNKEDIPPFYPCRGHYFSYSGHSPFNHLIYPLPEENLAGLGIHATLDLGGQVRFGPDTEYLSRDNIHDYRVDPQLRTQFANAIRSYFPVLKDEQLQPDYSGIRPKLHQTNQATADFVIIKTSVKPAAVHLFGIESPGLTASLAIAAHVTKLLQKSAPDSH